MAKCCSDIRICDMRHSITFQAENATADDGGGFTDPWDNPIKIATLKACVVPLKGFERLRAMQLETPISHKITTRYRSGLKPEHRILFGTRVFNVRAIINIEEKNKWLEIMADEGMAI